MRSRNLMEIQRSVVSWADDVLPERTVPGMLLKMVEELGEVTRDPSDALNLADLLILLVDIADHFDIDLSAAVDDRMQINRIKRWKTSRLTGVNNRVE